MSELGTLSSCMMDSDPVAARRAKRLRRRALGASLFLEMLLVAAILAVPLITPGVLPRHYIVIPLPPISAPKSPRPPHSHANVPTPHSDHPAVKPFVFHQPDRIPTHVYNAPDNTPPVIDEAPGSAVPGIPGGTGTGSGLPGEGSEPIVAPPRPSKPRTISIGVMEASLIHRVDPIYPDAAKALRISGQVKLHATIGTDGIVKDYQVVSGNPILARAAITAIRQWRYQPTKLDGEAVEVETLITVNFIMQ
jgi:TonB family protein